MRAWIGTLLLFAGVAACDKPSSDECRKAYANIRRVAKLAVSPTEETDTAAFVRQCRAQYSADAVRCVIDAKTQAEIDACTEPKK